MMGVLRGWEEDRAAIAGVSVNETTAETTMVSDSVTANSRKSRPMMPPISNSEISTAIKETLIDKMVKPIWPEPFSAAASGSSPSSI